MDFLGGRGGINPQVQNQCLLQAVSDYCEQGELNKEQAQAVKKQVFEYCKGQLASGDEIALTELSANLPTLNGALLSPLQKSKITAWKKRFHQYVQP